jgi:hypothetical protein
MLANPVLEASLTHGYRHLVNTYLNSKKTGKQLTFATA